MLQLKITKLVDFNNQAIMINLINCFNPRNFYFILNIDLVDAYKCIWLRFNLLTKYRWKCMYIYTSRVDLKNKIQAVVISHSIILLKKMNKMSQITPMMSTLDKQYT